MFVELDKDAQSIAKEILIQFPYLVDYSSDHEQADPFLIALAIQKSGKVITEEKALLPHAISDPKLKK